MAVCRQRVVLSARSKAYWALGREAYQCLPITLDDEEWVPLGELSQWIVALLFPALTMWSVTAANFLAHPDFPYDTSEPAFSDWNMPPIFRGKWGVAFLGVL
jgi:hypothetical protein